MLNIDEAYFSFIERIKYLLLHSIYIKKYN